LVYTTADIVNLTMDSLYRKLFFDWGVLIWLSCYGMSICRRIWK